MWAYFLINYRSLLAATISFILISFSLVLGIAAVILNRAMRQSQPWLAAGAFAPDLERNYNSSSLSHNGGGGNSGHQAYDEEIGLDFDATPRSTRGSSSSRGVRVGTYVTSSGTRAEQRNGGSRWRL